MTSPKVDLVVMTPAELQRLIHDTWREAKLDAQLPEVMTRDEVATLLGVNPRTVQNYVKSRGLPAHQLGQEHRFRRSEVLAWLTEQKGAA